MKREEGRHSHPAKQNDIQTLDNIWYYSYIVYDCLFTVLVLYEIYYRRAYSPFSTCSQDNKMYVVAFKAILHNIFSIGGVYAYINYAYYGTTILDLAACFSLHIINWKFERYFRCRSGRIQFLPYLPLTRLQSSIGGSSVGKLKQCKMPSVNRDLFKNLVRVSPTD